MPSLKCPSCDYRNVPSAHSCINCGASLNEDAADTTETNNEVSSHERASRERQHRKGDAVAAYQKPLSTRENTALEPYQARRELEVQQPITFMQTLVTEEQEVADPEPWKGEKLPWGLPRRRPDIAGKVVHIQSEMEFPDYPNVARALIDILSEVIWMTANQPAHREGERIRVTVVRIHTSDKKLKDARILGDLRGAHLSLGDTLLLWGWKRKGSLIVKKGYNYTSRATVTTNMLSMLPAGLILIAIAGTIFLLSTNWHSVWAFWSHIFMAK